MNFIKLPSGRFINLAHVTDVIPSRTSDDDPVVRQTDGPVHLTGDDAKALLNYLNWNSITLTPTGVIDPNEPDWVREATQ